ncbi:MAG: hypothetical protein HOW59_18150, partial [Nonomuraea sp.]|nr:hypothetical protein [Nonomuraea sp.]
MRRLDRDAVVVRPVGNGDLEVRRAAKPCRFYAAVMADISYVQAWSIWFDG